jgi:flagellin-like hook-associated protein FlgL
LRVNANIPALASFQSIIATQSNIADSVKRLASGLRVQSAKDDAAGLAISEKMTAVIRGTDQAARNAQDGQSMLRVAEGALGEIHAMIHRMRELSLQAANDTLIAEDRAYIQLEIDELTAQINDIANNTQFNKKKILNGDSAVLWSTSTSDIAVIVAGNLISKDAFGEKISAAGNYKLAFNTIQNGSESVWKSNVMYLKHGTLMSGLSIEQLSGLGNVRALNMVEGEWRLETRETPFGGVKFYLVDVNGTAYEVPAQNIGVAQFNASATPNIVAPGEYDIRVSDVVPMMADFKDALDKGVVTGVEMSGRAAASDFDAVFDIDADTSGAPSSSQVYRNDIAGGTVAVGTGSPSDAVIINTDPNYANNIFTHFAVTDTDARDVMMGDIKITESYVAANGATIDVRLDYMSKDPESVTFETTYRAQQADTINLTNSKKVDISSTMTLTDVQSAISTTLGTDFIVSVVGGVNNYQIQIQNNSGVATTVSGGTGSMIFPSSISVGGTVQTTGTFNVASQTTQLGITTTLTFSQTLTAGVSVGDNMDDVENKLDTALSGKSFWNGVNFDLSGAGSNASQGQIKMTNASGSTVSISSSSNEFFAAAAATPTTGTINGVSRDYQTQHTITGLGGKTMGEIRDTINSATTASYGVSAALSGTTAAQRLTFTKTGSTSHDFRIVPDLATDSIEYELGMNSVNFAYNVSGSQATANDVYNGHVLNVNVPDSDMSDISTKLNDAIKTALNGDGIIGNNNLDLVSFPLSAGIGQITLDNKVASAYKITISGTTADEMWSSTDEADRGDIITSDSRAYNNLVITLDVDGKNIENTLAAINAAGSASTFLAGWVDDVSHHVGHLTLTNNTANGVNRRKYKIEQADTVTQAEKIALFGASGDAEIWAVSNGVLKPKSARSNIIQARDNVTITITWDGNRASDASRISGSVGGIVIWEGDIGNVNAGRVNSAHSDLAGLFTSFDIKDTDINGTDGDNASDLHNKDAWMLYTKAYVSSGSGTADNVNLSLYDGKYVTGNHLPGAPADEGITTGITYSFQDGALDNKSVQIGELVRDASAGPESLAHHIEFGSVSDDATIKYGERMGAGNYWDNTAHVNSWYSHAYYGPDATYYFKKGKDPSDVVRQIIVNRQNDINASMLFMYDGGRFTVLSKGFDRGGNILSEASETLTAAQMAAISSGGPVTIHGIEFTSFNVSLGSLEAGDKFVVNVAAAAMLDGENAAPSAGDFQSTANIAVEGDPWRRGDDMSTIWGSAAQYRLANGAEDGKDLKLLGYFVDPINGSLSIPGVGYYDGQFEMKVDTNGFVPKSTVGGPGSDDTGASYIHAEVNYQGATEPTAGALVTSVYFSKMESGRYNAVKDFVAAVGYSNYNYGGRADGSYGPLNEAGRESYNSLNASLIFDAVKVVDNVITFRVQAHVVDLFGNEWYVEDEEFGLNGMANTDRDSTAVPPVIPSEVSDPVVLFRDSAFGGLYFDEFTLKDSSVWTEGDRFTLALTASGQSDPTIDEITLFSDQRGTTMPIGYRFYDGVLDDSSIDLGIYQLANNIVKPDSDHFANDQVMDGLLSLSFGKLHPSGVNTVDTAAKFQSTFQRGIDAGVAHYYSRMEDIKQFWDSNGAFILENNDQMLTIRQKDREIKIQIGSGEELGKLAEYMSERIWTDLLMQYDGVPRGKDDEDSVDYSPYLMREEDKHKIISLVNNAPGNSANETVVGTLLAHSVIPSKESALKFYGGEALMKAFAFTEIKEARDTAFKVSVSDAHSGKTVRSGVTVRAGERAYKIIADGVELDIDGDIGLVTSDYNAARGVFESTIEKQFSQYVHLADNAATLQIGASQGEDMTLTLGAVTAKALDIDNIDVRGRETAARSVTRLDNAIKRVSKQRAIIGAQINRLDHAISNLRTASQNLTGSRSRIVDVDMAREMVRFTKLNILNRAGVSMLAQANALPQNILSLLR